MLAPRRVYGAALCGAVLLAASAAAAQDAGGLGGSWHADALKSSWAIGEWSDACGPKPSGGGEAGGNVTLTESGADFTLQGLGRSYSSQQCWERLPGLRAQSHSAGASMIRTSCSMPAGDPRQASVVTSWALRGDSIYFDETGKYQLVTGQANCTASVRRTRRLTRIVAASEPAATVPVPAMATAEPPHEPPAAPPPSHCQKAGPPTRITVSPRTKLMRAGESFGFRVEARDARGCPAPVAAHWSMGAGAELGKLSDTGQLSIAGDAPSGQLVLVARIGDQSLQVTARVVSNDEYERLLAGGQFGVQGESLEQAVEHRTSSEVAVGTASSQAPSAAFPAFWLSCGLGAATLGAGLAFLGLRRRKPRAASLNETGAELAPESLRPASVVEAAPSGPAPQPVSLKVCPVCARTYPHETTFCGEDGTRLVRLN